MTDFRRHWFIFCVVGVATLVFLFVPELRVLLAAPAVLALLIALSYNLTWGWYILVFFSPLIQWELNLSFLHAWFPQAPWIFNAHAPVVEFWGVLMIGAFAIHIFRNFLYGKPVRLYAPGLPWYLLFIASAVVSLVNLPSIEIFSGVKYIFHSLLLFYTGYLMLGASVVDTKEVWQKSLKILAAVGFGGALMGAASLVLGVWQGDGFHRAVPFAIGGFMPFGDQHIFLAEILTTVAPIYLYFWHKAENQITKKWWGIGTWFVIIIALLTLSRAGWITLFVELVVFFYLTRRHELWKKILVRWWWLGAVLIIPGFFYLAYFLTTSPIARGSTEARWYFTDAALYLFKQHPVVGQGVGSFVNRASEMDFLVNQFGEPTDALGVVQKILAEQGLFGFIAFVLFIGWIMKTLLGRTFNADYTAEARTAYMVSVFLVLAPSIFQLFNTLFYTSKMWVPISLALAESLVYHHDTYIPKLLFNLKSRKSPLITEI